MTTGRRSLARLGPGALAFGAFARAIASVPAPASADEVPPGLLVGTAAPVSLAARRVPLEGSGGVAWEGELSVPGARHLFVFFDDVRLEGAGHFVVRLVDGIGATLAEYPGERFAAHPTFYSGEVDASEVGVQVVRAPSDVPSFVSFVVGEVARDPGDVALQSPHGAAGDPIPVRMLSHTDPVRSLSPSTLRVTIPHVDQHGQRDVFSCSGFVVGAGLALTNQHCLSRAEDCAHVTVYAVEGDALVERAVGTCSAIVDSSFLLDATIFAYDGLTGPTPRPPPLRFADAAPQQGEPLQLLGHPGGGELDVSRAGCSVDAPSVPGMWGLDDTDFAHSCSTSEGSSGSPILNARLEVVGLHHLGFDAHGPWSSENRAVKGTRLSEFVGRVLDRLKASKGNH